MFRSNSEAKSFWNPSEAGNQLNAGVLSQSASRNHALLITKSALMIKKKNALCLSQSAFSNFALYVITMFSFLRGNNVDSYWLLIECWVKGTFNYQPGAQYKTVHKNTFLVMKTFIYNTYATTNEINLLTQLRVQRNHLTLQANNSV